MTKLKPLGILLAFAFVLGLAQKLEAQYGESSVEYIPETGQVVGWTRTVIGYSAGFYYDAGVDGYWYANGSSSSQSAVSGSDAEVDFSAGAAAGGAYQVSGNHYADAYWQYWVDELQTYYYWDPYCYLDVYYYWYWYYYDNGDGTGDWYAVEYAYWYWEGCLQSYDVWVPVLHQEWARFYLVPTSASVYLPPVSASGSSPGGDYRGSSGTLTINGQFLGAAGDPSFGVSASGLSLPGISGSDGAVTASYSIPATSAGGSFTITVGTRLGSASVSFTVWDPTPAVFATTPASGQIGDPPGSVTISGAWFGSRPAIQIIPAGSGIAVSGMSATDNQITATLDLTNATANTYSVSVVSSGFGGSFVSSGSSTPGSNSVSFTVRPQPPPAITNLSPTSGPAGTWVTITGTNFGAGPVVLSLGSSAVTLNGVRMPARSWTNTQIVAQVPAGVAAGTGSVVVTFNGRSSNAVSFTVTSDATLSINGGSSSARVTPSTAVSLAFNLYDPAGANDIGWAQFYFADSSGRTYCYGNWGRPNVLNLYDGSPATTTGFGNNLSDTFCTVSLASITNSATDPTQVTTVLNFNFKPGPGGTYAVLTQINYGSGYTGPWNAVGTLIIDPGVTISGHVTASGYPVTGAIMTLSGSSSAVATTDHSGSYSFMQAAGGNYTLTASLGGLAFAPASVSWSDLRANQVADFTAVPDDYPAGSGLPSLLGSFTAPDPVLTCDDISGVWDDTDNSGNHLRWNLTQTGNSISGQMDYDAIRGGRFCGTLTYDVTGSYDSSSLKFSLSATIRGTPQDSCGFAVAASATETITLSGRACGTGSGTFGESSPQSQSPADFSVPLTKQAPSNMSRSEHNPRSPAATGQSQVIVGPRDAQIPASWTTISPRFLVQYSSYIPVDHVSGPTSCYLTLPTGETAAVGGLIYKGDAYRDTYRTTESLLVVPSVQKYTNLFARGGATRNYGTPSSPANGPRANLSTTPTGDLWNAPYTGADEDGVGADCHLWNEKGEIPNSTMRGVGFTWTDPITQVNLSGTGDNPLELRIAPIRWDLTISLDTTDPKNPKASVSGGTTTCYPEHIVKVNGKVVYDAPPLRNDLEYIRGCLLFGSPVPVSPSKPVVVPAH